MDKSKKDKKHISVKDTSPVSVIIKDTLVLSGGSFRGIAHIGVLKALEETNILKNIKTFSGTSVGAMVSVFHAIGYTTDELMEVINDLDFEKLKHIKLGNFLSSYGIDDGRNMLLVFEKMFEYKDMNKNITFIELYQKTNIKLILTGVCLNDKKVYYFSHETYPNMSIITALRITTCVPFWFAPVEYESKLFIDGGVMNNYPINLFNEKLDNVIGVYLNESRDTTPSIDNFESFLSNTVECIFEGMGLALIGNYSKQTINLNLPKSQIFSLLNSKEKRELYTIGYTESMNFIKNMNNLTAK